MLRRLVDGADHTNQTLVVQSIGPVPSRKAALTTLLRLRRQEIASIAKQGPDFRENIHNMLYFTYTTNPKPNDQSDVYMLKGEELVRARRFYGDVGTTGLLVGDPFLASEAERRIYFGAANKGGATTPGVRRRSARRESTQR